jgi:hypothetical protein
MTSSMMLQAVVLDGAAALGDFQAQIRAAVLHLGFGLAPGFVDDDASIDLRRRRVLLHRELVESLVHASVLQAAADPFERQVGHLGHRGDERLAAGQVLEERDRVGACMIGPADTHQAHAATPKRHHPPQLQVDGILVLQLKHAFANPVVARDGHVQLADAKLGGEFLRPAVPTIKKIHRRELARSAGLVARGAKAGLFEQPHQIATAVGVGQGSRGHAYSKNVVAHVAAHPA